MLSDKKGSTALVRELLLLHLCIRKWLKQSQSTSNIQIQKTETNILELCCKKRWWSKTNKTNIPDLCLQKRWWSKNQQKPIILAYAVKSDDGEKPNTETRNKYLLFFLGGMSSNTFDPCEPINRFKRCYFHRLWKTYSCGSSFLLQPFIDVQPGTCCHISKSPKKFLSQLPISIKQSCAAHLYFFSNGQQTPLILLMIKLILSIFCLHISHAPLKRSTIFRTDSAHPKANVNPLPPCP